MPRRPDNAPRGTATSSFMAFVQRVQQYLPHLRHNDSLTEHIHVHISELIEQCRNTEQVVH